MQAIFIIIFSQPIKPQPNMLVSIKVYITGSIMATIMVSIKVNIMVSIKLSIMVSIKTSIMVSIMVVTRLSGLECLNILIDVLYCKPATPQTKDISSNGRWPHPEKRKMTSPKIDLHKSIYFNVKAWLIWSLAFA